MRWRSKTFFCFVFFIPYFSVFGKDKDFLGTINQSKYHDPYDPKVHEDLFVGYVQVASHADYTTDTGENLHLGYYFAKSTQLYLDIPEFEGEYLSIGAEHMLSGAYLDKNWLGVAFVPKSSDISIHFRGVNYRSPTAKIHYKLAVTIYDQAQSYHLGTGYYTHPFRRSRNSFLDFRGQYNYFDGNGFNVSNLSLIALVGHGWANFAEVEGLEIHGGIGFEYGNYSFDGNSDSDVDLRIELRALYQSIL